MEHLNILAYDHEAAHLDSLKEATLNIDANISLTTFLDAENFLSCLTNSAQSPDAVLIDGDKHDKEPDGFDVMQTVAKQFPHINIICTFTSLGARVQQLFLQSAALRPSGVLMYPYRLDLLERMFAIILQRKIESRKVISIMTKSRHTLFESMSISLVESNRRKLLYTIGNKTIECYGQIKKIQEKLPDYFLVPHTSYLVNAYAIKSFDKLHVYLKNGRAVPISRNCKQHFFDSLQRITRIRDLAKALDKD